MRLHAIDDDNLYTGLDRFGRVDDQWYLNTSTSATVVPHSREDRSAPCITFLSLVMRGPRAQRDRSLFHAASRPTTTFASPVPTRTLKKIKPRNAAA